MYKQLRDASMAVGYVGGWCLKYVQDAFGTDHIYPTAMDAWNNEPNKHTDTPPLGITVPIYLSLGNVPAGHVAIRLDDGWVASSTQPGDHATPYYHKSIDDLVSVYGQYNGGAIYLGWGEHVGSVQVVESIPATSADQVNQDYLDILERPADSDGLQHYTSNGMTNDQVRADLLASAEYQTLQQRKAAQSAQPAPNPVTAPIHNPEPTPEPVQAPVAPEPTSTPSQPVTPVVEPSTTSNVNKVNTMQDKNTPAGKAIRTGYQALVGIIPLVTAILSVPQLRDAANGVVTWSTALIPVLAAVVAYFQNKKGI